MWFGGTLNLAQSIRQRGRMASQLLWPEYVGWPYGDRWQSTTTRSFSPNQKHRRADASLAVKLGWTASESTADKTVPEYREE